MFIHKTLPTHGFATMQAAINFANGAIDIQSGEYYALVYENGKVYIDFFEADGYFIGRV